MCVRECVRDRKCGRGGEGKGEGRREREWEG